MKLELKHIAPYLPYGLKGMVTHPFCKEIDFIEGVYYTPDELITLSDNGDWYFDTENNEFDFKPILRPLSDLNISVRLKGEVFNPCTKLYEYSENQAEEDFVEHILNNQKKPSEIKWESCPWYAMVLMFQWHFDVFGLIPAGLAIDINTLNK